jgi:hypothetical protein
MTGAIPNNGMNGQGKSPFSAGRFLAMSDLAVKEKINNKPKIAALSHRSSEHKMILKIANYIND